MKTSYGKENKDIDHENFQSILNIDNTELTEILLEKEYDSLDSIDEEIFNKLPKTNIQKKQENGIFEEENFKKIIEYLDRDLENENKILECLIEIENKIDAQNKID